MTVHHLGKTPFPTCELTNKQTSKEASRNKTLVQDVSRARTRIQLISISINPDGKPPCRKVLNNNADQYEKPKMREKKISSCGNYPNSDRLDKPNNNAVHQYFFEHMKLWLKPPCRNVVHNLVTTMSKLAPMQKDSKSNRLDQPNLQEQEECSSLVFLEALKP